MSSKHDEGKRVDEERRDKRMKEDKKKVKKSEKADSKKNEKSKDDLEAIKAKAKQDQEKEQKKGNAKSNDDRAKATGEAENAKKAPPPDPKKAKEFVLWFDDLSSDDVALVGGKTSSLGEMYRQLTSKGVNVPNGFAVTAYAYRYFLEKAGIEDQIKEALGPSGQKDEDVEELKKRGKKVRAIIMDADFPEEIAKDITEAYKKLDSMYKEEDQVDVAVRSSATAEDLPEASFAGQQESYLNVVGEKQLLQSCKKCMASLFTDRAICYREEREFDHMDVALSIAVQKMVRSDKACSGVAFTIDTETGYNKVVLITGSWGLGENVVQGTVTPDEFIVFKDTLKKGARPIVSRKLGSKEMTMTYHPTKQTINTPTRREEKERFCMTDDEVLQLAKWACIIEDHYSQKKGKYTPMDIEWAKDGISGELYIVQARPETVQSRKNPNLLKTFKLKGEGRVVAKGTAVGHSIATGKARVLESVSQMHQFEKGEILVTEITDPDWEPILKKAKAVITDRGGRSSHAAITSREMAIPCIVGCHNATEKIKTGQMITVDTTSGDEGLIYDGEVEYEVVEADVGDIERVDTKIMMNLANPEQAYSLQFIPNDGVGLVRMEFIVSNHIRVHPMALLRPDKLQQHEQEEIRKLIRPCSEGKEYFVRTLAQGVGTICAAFYPKRVILRFSDFKTNEYAGLLGGKHFEPDEENPMLGWRGASRYYDPDYRDGFALECAGVKMVREEFGLTNLDVMIPFCRTITEAKKVIKEMEKNDLKRNGSQGADRMRVMCMCEIPSNVILAREFLDIFDGYSIGSNDLTQLCLGVDRDSAIVSKVFDERDEAVKRLIKQTIEVCNEMGKYVGICGQAPSDYPEFADFLVECGIQSMSLNPDSVVETVLHLSGKDRKKEATDKAPAKEKGQDKKKVNKDEQKKTDNAKAPKKEKERKKLGKKEERQPKREQRERNEERRKKDKEKGGKKHKDLHKAQGDASSTSH